MTNNAGIRSHQADEGPTGESTTVPRDEVESILAAPDPLALVEAAIPSLGYGGDVTAPLLVYLAATTRLLPLRPGSMGAHTLIMGPSSAGKNAALAAGLAFIPAESIVRIDAGSPRVLIYDERPLEHRVVVFSEADSLPAGEDNPAASAIRNLLQDGSLHYDVTVRDGLGRFKVHHVTKAGPTVLLTTSTRRLGTQLMTRLFTLEVPAERAHLRAALEAQARLELEGPAEPDPALVAFQSFLQGYAPLEVVVPFVRPLHDWLAAQPGEPRVLRDAARLVALIKAVAIVRIAHRRRDDRGRLVATADDYAAVYRLVADLWAASTSASDRVREVVTAVARVATAKSGTVNSTDVARELGIDVATAWRRIQLAIEGGWLVNDEVRLRQAARLRLGEMLPPSEGLPSPDEVRGWAAGRSANAQTPIEHDEAAVFTFAPLPAGTASPTSPVWWSYADDPDDYFMGMA